ncbi:2OG-FeII_Oxy_2 domain-containing protein, partial [Cephalotus follicularis]
MEDEGRQLLRQVFGESSDSDTEEEDVKQNPHSPIHQKSHLWEPIKEIKGLWFCNHFLSPQLQSSLLSSVLNEGWFTKESHNQAMRFGNLPTWATNLSNSVRETLHLGDHEFEDLASYDGGDRDYLLPSDLLWREPLFDQLIVNVYQPGCPFNFRLSLVQGICAHVDLLRFEDGIAIVSLESSCVMHFTPVGDDTRMRGTTEAHIEKIPVLLTPGSLILMSGDARYLWKHEINRNPGSQTWEGLEINQRRRISITLRKLCQVDQ